MKKAVLAVGLVLGFIGTSVVASEAPSCADLKGFSGALREAADYISDTKGDFSDNEEMEKGMDELVSVLGEFAKQEGDPGLTDAMSSLEAIWEMEEWEGEDVGKFKRAFDATAVAVERVAKKHCQ